MSLAIALLYRFNPIAVITMVMLFLFGNYHPVFSFFGLGLVIFNLFDVSLQLKELMSER
jgi:hypothetical protein